MRPADRARWLAAASALVAGGLLLAGGGVPLYDGVGYPDEPYRFLAPPPGYKTTPPPTSADATAAIRAGRLAQDLVAATDEQGSQASAYVPAAGVALPPGAVTGTVRLTLRPALPSAPAPDGRLDGNIYVADLTSSTGPVSLAADAASPRLTLRDAIRPGTAPVVEFRAPGAGGWLRLPTDQVGADVYAAAFRGSGSYALVVPGPAAAGTPKGGGSGQLPLLLGAAVLLVVAALVGVRALGREREREPE